ncbi:GntR family transcriptional regulator [Virgibacillus halodenitrificans]|uniref:GntR family transcriptional regulator n=1 Tax=Virgibacillus halodenitrificans TaxID=1482 RepID=UPI0024C01DAA|nr:GntR family transcriptional regulator [Virgibacillus halodenitrificans]WHX25889.1 GntR family transcriptional regulator [Virgibacillus halodenitrificans]
MELPISISKDSRQPIYHQIENQLKALIVGGHLQADTPLPSIRALAKDMETSMITIRRSYQNLEHQGFIKTIQGKGTFVAHIKTELKQQVKIYTVYHEIEKAIDIAFDYDYNEKQIQEIFFEVLSSYKKKGD